MDGPYIEFRKAENIRPLTLPHREKLYMDMQNIEYSFSGRIGDGNIINTFIMEAAQLLINAIGLFESGYFDCAYYSLRSSIDISTTMVYLTDMPDDEGVRRLEDWKDTKDFPMQSAIVKELSKSGMVFSEMKAEMTDFFESAKALSQKLNKYVHKQGFQHFYVSRNHPLNQNKSQDGFISEFERYLKECIGVVAVMRLAADPFPVLLMDDEILYRCFDSMTEPYSQEFIDEYIGEKTVEAYKQTNIYQTAYASFISNEMKNEATFNVMKHQYIDTRRVAEIEEQFHLLTIQEAAFVRLASQCEKIVKLYAYGGFLMYFTDRKTNRKKMSQSGMEFKRFASCEDKYNQPYDEAYISAFTFRDESIFVEHNEILDSSDILTLNQVLTDMAKKETV